MQRNSGQERDKSFVSLFLLTLLSTTLAMAVADFFNQRERTREEVERSAVETIERLLAEFGDRIAAGAGKTVAAIYIRYSTNFQDSFEAQLRAILSEAVIKDLSISRENIFYDLGISGAKYDREGLNAIRAARRDGRFSVFVALATSRLARNLKTLLEVLDEEFVGNGTRCILVDQRLDSNDIERWKLLLPLLGWLDEIQRTNQAGHVRAAHRMLLARRIFYSSETYGFGGEIIPGFFTKRGRPVRMMIVDETTAEVVKFVFEKFNSGVSIGRIVKQLNASLSVPPPPKSNRKRFSRDFVKRVLGCESYLGVFVYNNETDVSTSSPDEMRELANTDGNVFSFPELQIVPDEVFLLARQRLQANAEKLSTALRSSKSKQGMLAERPMLLNGFLFCPECDNLLVVTGARGNAYGCKTCKFQPADQQFLYSQMPRRLSTDLIVKAICDEVFANETVLARSVAQFLVEAEKIQRPDPGQLEKLKKDRKQVKDQLGMLIGAFKGDDADLVKDELNAFRSRLTKLDCDIAKEQKLVDRVLELPAESDAYQVLAEFSKVLQYLAADPTDHELDQARELLCLLTGGRIEAYQCGERKAQRGWLQVRFTVNVAAALMERAGVDRFADSDSDVEIRIDVREEAPENPKIALARELYDQDYFESEIAVELRASRASICKWIQYSFDVEGGEKPDGGQRRKRIEKARGLHHYQQISDEVFKLAEAGVLLCEIAEQLKTNRDVITDSLRYACEKRGLPWLDGRARRKSLVRKSR